jgi:thioredoxin 1
MSTPTATTDQTFNDDLPAEGIAVIDFWAEWCGPCRSFAPVFEASAAQNPDVVHLKVEVDTNPALSNAFSVQSIPTTVFLRDRVVLGAVPGAMGATQLADLLRQVREIDMDQVQAEADAPAVDVNEAPALVEAGAVIIDVREEDEFAEGTIPGARNVPLGRLADELDTLPRDRTIALLCRSGNRSGKAQELLLSSGFDAVNLEGGMLAWQGGR